MTDYANLIEQARAYANGRVGTGPGLADALADAVETLKAERDRLAAALTKLANPTHEPKGEEAVLVQMEVVKIAREALAATELAAGGKTPP